MAHLIAKRRQESKERHVRPHPVTGKLETTYDPVPPDACQYGKASFWDGRYGTAPEAFDWYHPYDAISGIIEKYIEPGQKVINLGCGNSTLTEEMYADGYDNIWNIDLSRVAIDLMTSRCADISRSDISFKQGNPTTGESQAPLKEKEVTGIQWHQGDATDMTPFLEDKVFDAAIDKGCLDALFCSDVPKRNVHKYLQEVERVLKEEGVYIVFSYGRPEDDRLAFLDNDDPDEVGFLAWTVDVHAIPKPQRDPYKVVDKLEDGDVYYVYVCKKNVKLDNEKDLKKKHAELVKKGKKIKKKGPKR